MDSPVAKGSFNPPKKRRRVPWPADKYIHLNPSPPRRSKWISKWASVPIEMAFIDAGEESCTRRSPRRAWLAVLGLGMMTALYWVAPSHTNSAPQQSASAAATAPISEPYDATYQQPARPITMGGFSEIRNDWTRDNSTWLAQDQAKYIKDKTELERDIAACRAGDPKCHPRIRDFANMLDQVADTDDRLQQVKIINAWVNMIPYDYVEALSSKSDLEHHSLSEALTLNLLVCDENARLKLFALEFLEYNEDDIRLVREFTYNGIDNQPNRHVVTEVRIGDDIWIMNINRFTKKFGNITLENAFAVTNDKSQIESDTAHLNISGNSFWSLNGRYLIPCNSFNSRTRSFYNYNSTEHSLGDIPAVAQNAEAKRDWLGSAAETTQVMSIMASAFAPNYTIDGHTPAHTVTLRSTTGRWGYNLINRLAKYIF